MTSSHFRYSSVQTSLFQTILFRQLCVLQALSHNFPCTIVKPSASPPRLIRPNRRTNPAILMRPQPLQPHTSLPAKPRRNRIQARRLRVVRIRTRHHAADALGRVRCVEGEDAAGRAAVVERVVAWATFKVGALAQRERGPGPAVVVRVRVRREGVRVLGGDLDEAVVGDVELLAAGDEGELGR